MAIRLVTEVMDWAPPLTHREHKVLMILAENAKLPSRETWDSVEDPKILRRARLNRTQMYEVIAVLVDKGCLDKPVWGGKNHRAKYAIGHLANHDQCQENPDTDHGSQCPGLQDTDHGGQDHDQRPRKPGHRLPVSTGGSVAQAEGATTATPSQTRKRVHDGPEEPLPPDERNLTNGVPLQSPATARIAREAAEALREWERLHPEAAQ